jgi:hypothetical protein
MPVLTVSAETVEGQPTKEAGLYQVQLVGFKPKMSKRGDSINLNPQMKIVNNPVAEFNGNHVFDTLNTLFGSTVAAFHTCFGSPISKDPVTGQYNYMISIDDPQDPNAQISASNIERCNITSPLIGQVGALLLEVEEDKDYSTGQIRKNPDGTTKNKNVVKQYLARS